jgi:aryl-alcohol dehydrogenase-like predicted oxidoreductase
MEYSILNRRIESNGVLKTAKQLNISIIAYSPLAQGIVSGKFHDNPDLMKNMHRLRKRKLYNRIHRGNGLVSSKPVIDMLRKIAQEHDSTPSQIALSWLINYHGDTVFAIPGATNVKQTTDNMKAVSIELSQKELDDLNIASNHFKLI